VHVLQDFQTIHIGEHDIEKQEITGGLSQQPNPLFGRVGAAYLVTPLSEQFAQAFAHAGFIIDDQNSITIGH
jgi:hypothetical protein